VTVVTRVQSRAERAVVKHRKSVDKLSPDELKRLRQAIQAALDTKDNRGYQYFAGWHGVPFDYCWHHHPLFLPWHRAYLYFFELSLQRHEPEVTLPWWDWSVERDIPAAYQEGILSTVDIKPFTDTRRPSWPKKTSRRPGADPRVPPLPYGELYRQALEQPSFGRFNEAITQVHDWVHVWVGGTMSDPQWAAYDPIFWAHHCMVDRAWRIWQHHHPGANPPAEWLDDGLRPRALTVRRVLDVKQLGYDYAGTSSTVPGTT
jgi:tyrosinase